MPWPSSRTLAMTASTDMVSPPWNAYAVSQYTQRRWQPVRRTSAHGQPEWRDSPMMAGYISRT